MNPIALTPELLEQLVGYEWSINHFINSDGDEYMITISEILSDGSPEVIKEAITDDVSELVDMMMYLCEEL